MAKEMEVGSGMDHGLRFRVYVGLLTKTKTVKDFWVVENVSISLENQADRSNFGNSRNLGTIGKGELFSCVSLHCHLQDVNDQSSCSFDAMYGGGHT